LFNFNILFFISSQQRLQCCKPVLQLSTMVVLVDLDDEPSSPSPHAARASDFTRHLKPVHHSLAPPATDGEESALVADERPNPNINGFSAALSCYP
jgi:hypothetical protein